MSEFRNPPFFSRLTPLFMLLFGLRKIGLAKQFYKSIILPRFFSDEINAKAFEGYEPIAHDVFATTYPKSGGNWLLQTIQQITWLGEAEFDHIYSVVPWPESIHSGIIPLLDDNQYQTSPTKLRVIKSHAKTDYIPYNKEATYITVVRDPKEVFVSSFHFLPVIFGLRGYFSVEEWLEVFLSSKFPAGSWAVHTAGFWAWRDRPNVLVIFFSEIIQDPRGSIQRIADVMKVKLTEMQFEKIRERCSYAYMKAHEDQFGPPIIPFLPKGGRAIMVREGKTGNSDELLGPEQQDWIDRFMLFELDRLGSDFPYVERFMKSNPS